MAKLKYIQEFNKIVHNIDFLSSFHDASLSNKLLLIQQDLADKRFNFESFDICNFYSNVFNILSQCSDSNSILANGCMDVLLKTTESRNASLVKAMNFVNFLPAIIKLILNSLDVDDEKLTKLLTLTKNLIRTSQNELDEHNTKLIIEVLRDCVENSRSDSSIFKLSLNILSDLIMKNVTARHQVLRILQASKLGDKIDKSSDLIGLKFLVAIGNEVTDRDFIHLITLSFKNIQNGVSIFDIEPVFHSKDLIEFAENSKTERNIYDCEENLKYFDDLNKSLINALENNPDHSISKEEFFNNIFAYYGKLLKLDSHLASEMELFVTEILNCEDFLRSEKALEFISIFVSRSGQISTHSIERVVTKFNENEIDCKFTCEEKSAYLNFLQACHSAKLIEGDHINAISDFLTKIIDGYNSIKVYDAEENFIFLMVHTIKTLSMLSQESNIFDEKLKEILSHEHIPIVLARAFLTKDKEILMNVINLGSIENYPVEKVAHILSKSNQVLITDDKKNQEKQREAYSSSSKYINRIMGQELNTLIHKINEKLDNNELESLRTSDMLSIYRHKNNYLNDHLNSLNASLEKFTDLSQDLRHQNSVFRKVAQQQELINWCLEMDKENLQKENKKYFDAQQRLKASVVTFQNKITKENQSKVHAQKVLKLKEIENESKFKIIYAA